MSNFIKDIAQYSGESGMPNDVTLAANPNFLQLVGKKKENVSDESKSVDCQLIVNTFMPPPMNISLTIKEHGNTHTFTATADKAKVDSTTFYTLYNNKAATAENLRRCLLKNSFLRNNFDITLSPVVVDGKITAGSVIDLKSKGAGSQYVFEITSVPSFITKAGYTNGAANADLLRGDATDVEIEMEYYGNTAVFLGEHRLPQNIDKMGTYITTQSKAYRGMPVWFDFNSLARNFKPYTSDIITRQGWCNAGTLSDYRIVGKRFDGANTETFYISDVMYALNGYTRNLEENNLAQYVYSMDDIARKVKPLTKQPQLMHIRGQKQYFNFLLSDSKHSQPDDEVFKTGRALGIIYRLFTQAGKLLGEHIRHERNSKYFDIANSICLEFDDLLGEKVGRVDVYLSCDGEAVSEPLVFTILPDCLYRVNDFVFLNSLGGWSSFNFSGIDQTEFKTKVDVFYKTQTPAHRIHSEIESVHTRDVEEQFVVQTMPVNRITADWLRELSASPVVYHVGGATNRYVIIDDMTVKHNSKDDLFVLQMKYHYSDVYNAG